MHTRMCLAALFMRAKNGTILYSNENGWTTTTNREVNKAYKQDIGHKKTDIRIPIEGYYPYQAF